MKEYNFTPHRRHRLFNRVTIKQLCSSTLSTITHSSHHETKVWKMYDLKHSTHCLHREQWASTLSNKEAIVTTFGMTRPLIKPTTYHGGHSVTRPLTTPMLKQNCFLCTKVTKGCNLTLYRQSCDYFVQVEFWNFENFVRLDQTGPKTYFCQFC